MPQLNTVNYLYLEYFIYIIIKKYPFIVYIYHLFVFSNNNNCTKTYKSMHVLPFIWPHTECSCHFLFTTQRLWKADGTLHFFHWLTCLIDDKELMYGNNLCVHFVYAKVIIQPSFHLKNILSLESILFSMLKIFLVKIPSSFPSQKYSKSTFYLLFHLQSFIIILLSIPFSMEFHGKFSILSWKMME